MSLEVLSCCARVVALWAAKRFFSTMNQHVFLQISYIDARVTTLVATVGLLSTMLSHVFLVVFGHRKGDIALTA